MAAILPIDSSLVQYVGGYGKALGSIGNSLAQIGQAKLDLEQKDTDNKRSQAYLDLQNKMYDQSQKDKFDAQNREMASNVATNAMLMGIDTPTEMSNDYLRLSQIKPEITAASIKQENHKYTVGNNLIDDNGNIIFQGKGSDVPHTQQLANGNIGVWDPDTKTFKDTGQKAYTTPVQPHETPEWKMRVEWNKNHGEKVPKDSPYRTNPSLRDNWEISPFDGEAYFKKQTLPKGFQNLQVKL